MNSIKNIRLNSIKNIRQLAAISRTSLGIDISEDKISIALLRQTKEGVQIVKSANGPIPAGAIEQGNVKDPVLLAKAIKALKNSCKISKRRAVVSLFAHPVLTQIMQLPGNLPDNIGHYVQKEAKHCAVLPCKNIMSGYCGISASKTGSNRVFTVATEIEKVNRLMKALQEAGIIVEAIEPAEIACCRALYEKEIAGNLGSNVLITLIDGANATLIVFRNQAFDFIRKRDIGGDICQSDDGRKCLAEEIDTIIHYYAMEIDDSARSWRVVTVVRRDGQNTEEVSGFLKSRFPDMEIEVVSEAGPKNMSFAVSSDAQGACLIAVGLAVRLLDVPQPKLKINLIPPKSAEVRVVKQDMLIAANIAVSVLFVMLMIVAILKLSLNRTDKVITRKEKEQSSQETGVLLIERAKLKRQANNLREEIEKLNKLVSSGYTGNWGMVLDEIRRKTPESLWITSITGSDGSGLAVKGWSTSYEAIHLFVDMLGKSKHIESATLVEAEKKEGSDNLVSYAVNCTLVAQGGS